MTKKRERPRSKTKVVEVLPPIAEPPRSTEASSSNPKVVIREIGPEVWANLPVERRETVAARIRQRIGRKTLVIIGTSPDSCGLTPWNEPYIDGFWSLNDCHVLPFMQPHLNQVTAWFQLHHRWRFMRPTPRYGAHHYEWLKQDHPFPIYMQKHYDDIPNSVEYPLKEVCEKYLAGKIGRAIAFQRKYFTSSFGPMVGLALLQGYTRIEFYGMELAQQFEYVIQKPNAEFWMGIAVGHGCQIYVPMRCRMMSGPLYGWRWPDVASAKQEWDEAKKTWEERVAKGVVDADKALKVHLESFRPTDDMKDEDNVGFWHPYPDEQSLNIHIYNEPPMDTITPSFMKTLQVAENP